MTEGKILAFACLRPHKLPYGFDEDDPACLSLKIAIKERLIKLIEEENVRHFITAMTMGIDMICGEIVTELMPLYPGITLEAAAPHREQDILWPQKYRNRYRAVLDKCANIYIGGAVDDDDCVEKRNKYMADKCDMLLAVWNKKPDGMGSTVRYAQELKKPIITINPFKL